MRKHAPGLLTDTRNCLKEPKGTDWVLPLSPEGMKHGGVLRLSIHTEFRETLRMQWRIMENVSNFLEAKFHEGG